MTIRCETFLRSLHPIIDDLRMSIFLFWLLKFRNITIPSIVAVRCETVLRSRILGRGLWEYNIYFLIWLLKFGSIITLFIVAVRCETVLRSHLLGRSLWDYNVYFLPIRRIFFLENRKFILRLLLTLFCVISSVIILTWIA